MADRRPWERVQGETPKAFAAFELFRQLGPDRTVDEAFRRYWMRPGNRRNNSGRTKEKTPAYFSHWAVQYQWWRRAAAWDGEVAALARDQELDRELRARVAEQEEEIRQRQLRREEARAARAVGRRGLLRILQEVERQGLEAIGLAELISHLKRILDAVTEGQRLERLEAGQPTEITAQLSDDTADAIAKIIERYVPLELQDEVAGEVDAAIASEMKARSRRAEVRE